MAASTTSTTESSVLNEAREFVNTHYPLKDAQQPDLNKFKRSVWYCNLSGYWIQKLNPSITPQKETKSKWQSGGEIAKSLFNEGYDHYRVFDCGHLILDVYLILTLFDNIKAKRQNTSQIISQSCPCCSSMDKAYPSPYNQSGNLQMYIVSNGLSCGGTVSLANIIPEPYLPHLTSLFEKGDVVDCRGYRGTNIHMFNGKRFKPVQTGEYYPIFPLKYLKLRGYGFYLTFQPELILFDTDISYCAGMCFTPYDCSSIKLGETGNTDMPEEIDDAYRQPTDDELKHVETKLDYPFTDVKLVQKCFMSDREFWTLLPTGEKLVIGKREMFIGGTNHRSMSGYW